MAKKAAPKKKAPKPKLPPASDRVRLEWLHRVEAEYRSATITHHVTHWLMQIAASPDLIRAGLRIVEDEIVHSELSMLAYQEAGGHDMPSLPRETLQLVRHEQQPLEYDVTRVATSVFCLGETVAVPLFTRLRHSCKAAPGRRVLDRVLRDEVRHRDFGWTLLPYMFELPMGGELRHLVTRELPAYFHTVRLSYGARARADKEMSDEDRAWGLMPPAEYAEITDRTLERDWIPRFAEVGIDAKLAWERSL